MNVLVLFGAIVAPFLYALTNHIDKLLLEKYFKEGGVGTLLLFSSLLSLIALPVIAVVEPKVLEVDVQNILFLGCVGVLNLALLWSYLSAMNEDEPTAVIIFYQLVPVIGLGLGYVFLDEVITTQQLVAMMLIVGGSTIMTIATDEDGIIRFRLRSVSYMLLASFCWAAETTLFKVVALEENVWRSLFWENASLVVLGVILFSTVSRYRTSFLKAVRLNSKPIMALNVMNEGIYALGNASAAYMVMLIPVALNLLMNSFQPLFVFLIGIILSKFFPNYSTEEVMQRWKQKLTAVALTAAGVYLIGSWD